MRMVMVMVMVMVILSAALTSCLGTANITTCGQNGALDIDENTDVAVFTCTATTHNVMAWVLRHQEYTTQIVATCGVSLGPCNSTSDAYIASRPENNTIVLNVTGNYSDNIAGTLICQLAIGNTTDFDECVISVVDKPTTTTPAITATTNTATNNTITTATTTTTSTTTSTPINTTTTTTTTTTTIKSPSHQSTAKPQNEDDDNDDDDKDDDDSHVTYIVGGVVGVTILIIVAIIVIAVIIVVVRRRGKGVADRGENGGKNDEDDGDQDDTAVDVVEHRTQSSGRGEPENHLQHPPDVDPVENIYVNVTKKPMEEVSPASGFPIAGNDQAQMTSTTEGNYTPLNFHRRPSMELAESEYRRLGDVAE